MTDANAQSRDLLYGVKAIAAHLTIRERQAYHLIESGELPTFKLGGKVCARATTLDQLLADREAAARTTAAAGAAGD